MSAAVKQAAGCGLAAAIKVWLVIDVAAIPGKVLSEEVPAIIFKEGCLHPAGRPVDVLAWGPFASLLEHEWDARGRALVAQAPGPVRVHGPGVRAALAAADDPVDSRQVGSSIAILVLAVGGATQG